MGDEFRPQRTDADPGAGGELEILRHPSVEQKAAFVIAVVDEAQRVTEFVEPLLVERRFGEPGLPPVAGRDARAFHPRLELAGVGDELHLDPRIGNADHAGIARPLGDADRRGAGLGRTERSHHRDDFADRLEPEPFVALANVGRERGAGVAESLQPREQAPPQLPVGLEIRQKHLEASRHVVINGRRDSLRLRTVASIAPGSGRPSSMKNEPPLESTRLKLLLPPKVWLHGSQSISVGGSAAKLGLTPRSIAWFDVIIRWVLITPLGVPVEPEVNRSLAIVSGPTFAWARSTSARGLGRQHRLERVARRGGGRVRPDDDLHVRRHGRLDRGGEGTAVVCERQARRQQPDDRLELGEILGDQRIGRRHGRVRNAGDHRAEADQGVIDAVAGEDRDRPLDGEVPVDQALGDAARRRARRGVGYLAPLAPVRALALGQKHPLRRDLGPVIEPVGRGAGIGAQRVGRARQHDAVRATLDDHLGRTEGQLRPHHPLFLPRPQKLRLGGMVAVVAALGPDPEPARRRWRRRGFGRSPKIAASRGKPTKIYESEIAFFCFLWFSGSSLFKRLHPIQTRKNPLPARQPAEAPARDPFHSSRCSTRIPIFRKKNHHRQKIRHRTEKSPRSPGSRLFIQPGG